MLSARWDLAAANGVLVKVVSACRSQYGKLADHGRKPEIEQNGQDHRFIKRLTKPMMGFGACHPASATLAGIEIAHMIRKNQFANDYRSPFKVFAELSA